MIRRVSREDILEEIGFLRDMKEPFKFFVNNHTYKLESKLGNYFNTDSGIPFNQLSFVRQVSSHVKNSNALLRIPNNYRFNKKEDKYIYDNIKYFDYKPHQKNTKYWDDIYEIDINQAYWEVALKLGIITKELYVKGLKMHKKTRLASLGSLAKRTKIFTYDGKSMGRKPLYEESKETEYLWFKICEKLGETMYKAAQACGNKFIFYWVDGIYVKGMDAVIKVCESFANDGYDYKIMKMRWIDFNVDEKQLWVCDETLPTKALSDLGMQFPNRQKIIHPLTDKSNFKNKSIFCIGGLFEIGKVKGGKVDLYRGKNT